MAYEQGEIEKSVTQQHLLNQLHETLRWHRELFGPLPPLSRRRRFTFWWKCRARRVKDAWLVLWGKAEIGGWD